MISVVMDPTVKYRSIFVYVLTSTEKTVRDRIWWVVLVGRYPSERRLTQTERRLTQKKFYKSQNSVCDYLCSSKLWRLMRVITSKKTKKGDHDE